MTTTVPTKENTLTPTNNMEGIEGHGPVGKLLSRSKDAAKRRWKKQPSKESFGSTASSEEHPPRGRSPHSREHPPHDVGEGLASVSPSKPSDTWIVGEEDTSPTTYSELESSPTRPTIPSTHPSQIGQLSTSSPIIQAEYLQETQNFESMSTESLDSLSRSQTYCIPASSQAAPSRQLSTSKTGLQLPRDSDSSRRSRSPAGRFKDVFKTKRTPSVTPSVESQQSENTDKTDNAAEADPNAPKVVAPETSRRPRKQKIDVSTRPQTPPPSEPPAPVIVNTPPTPTDHAHPKEPAESDTSNFASNPIVTVSPSSAMISHRRMRSGSGTSIGPSKLSNITLAPLTPTPENAGPPTPGGGFFSSMLSAAQNAANTLTSTVNNTNIGIGGNKIKSTTIPKETREGDGNTTEVESSAAQPTDVMGEPAVKTLGMGDLSLSQLGIQESGSAAPTPVASKFPDMVDSRSRSRSDSAPEGPSFGVANGGSPSDDQTFGRPRSINEPAGFSDRSPPASVYEGKSGLQRSGSIRSKISRSRKRGSTGGTAGTSGTNGTTIGAAIAAANASVAHPQAAGSTPKLTGFAVASKKRNKDFHALFKSVPDDDYLIEDYSCALQREILAHGRLYVSEGHLCFSSNILGWVTTLVMSFDEIVSVEKRSTALLFKNGLMISTLHAKHVFASFTSRDSTYDLIVNIWKLGHPTLRSSLNGISVEGTGGDKTEKVDDIEPPGANSGSGSDIGDEDDEEDSEDDEDVYDEDDDDDDLPVFTQETEGSPADTEGEKIATRKVSGAMGASAPSDKPKDGAAAPSPGADFPGPATHGPTDCGDVATHYERILGDDIIPAPLGKVYNLIFGPASPSFMGKWLTVEQKCTDLQMEDKSGLTSDTKSRNYTYIKPLNASIGPRQTKCIVVETLENLDLEKAVNVLVVVQNPDVPSGNVFSVKTKYCLHWAENNSTRVQVNCTIEWTGKSWLKGPIEKGANDGQTQYCKDLFAHLKASVSSRPRSATLTNGVTAKGKKKKGKGKLQKASKEDLRAHTHSTAKKTDDWGLFEPLHGIFGPIGDIMMPIFTGNVVYGLLVGLLVATWFGFGFSPREAGPSYGQGLGFLNHPDRITAYEEIWRREESDLWDWLEERVGLHRMNEGVMPIRKHVVEPRTVEEKMREERMNEREIEEAIRITEEKLQVLKGVHERKKLVKDAGSGPVNGRPTSRPSEDR
ncbi:uncharacterized protein BCR38DRAFT_432134 [Pseudomassariella vexata]|uniref:VASt domain-containing protein n=1 Tax=Pseudomassariella vexata TaxID=1141098 RepID=A0A1Y2E150_9PEZI|nr:uncharacterized protein BCR38DRAFT_432134 [Pseudomassariella vexata]ORY65209.1 hypothetical protein BCR38DRAFT_432134 [Pseudomassariella vexata]